ncbi:MAG: YbhB/YbcL family Raf kinase inhibitor-like protein [Chitinivibrionales bacterium]|nr:YbhB/YbcL family Raf kinase inhibitor-like protein [Chitinivibrionales bacterium]
MKLSSPAFENDGTIPERFTCKGENVNPQLNIGDIPQNAKSLCIIMHDPDAPSGDFVHWVDYNIVPTAIIPENSGPGRQGRNDFGHLGYGGPCPPADGAHRYVTELHALDRMLDIPEGASRSEVETALDGHELASAELTGEFSSLD